MKQKREKCGKCGFRIRSKKHNEGQHHNDKVPRLEPKRSRR